MKKHDFDFNMEDIKEMIRKGYSLGDMGKYYGCHRSTVDSYLRKNSTCMMDIQLEVMKNG